MAQKESTTNLTELLLECVSQPDSMLSMLEWVTACFPSRNKRRNTLRKPGAFDVE